MAKEDEVNVLIINSYNDQYEWTVNTVKGINDALKSSDIHSNIRIEYLDTKSIINNKYFHKLYELFQYKYKDVDFDVIISTDDNALRFLLKYRDTLFPDVPIFFCGVNSLVPYENENFEKIYGIVERNSLLDTVDVAIRQNSDIKMFTSSSIPVFRVLLQKLEC